MALPDRSTITIRVAGDDISDDVVYAQTQFTISASAEPGTCSIYVRDPDSLHDFAEGSTMELLIDGTRYWYGYLFDVEMGYVFEDFERQRRWMLGGVDLNILLDKLILYNHAHPTRYPDGGGEYKRVRVLLDGRTVGYQVQVPRHTQAGPYIRAMLNDFDITRVTPNIKKGKIEAVGEINPDGHFTPPGSGTTLRDFLIDTSRQVFRSRLGSTIFYIDPDAFLVFTEQDHDLAPFWVGDENPANVISGRTGENVRSLRIRRQISTIKNDVLVFASELDPRPESRQTRLKYAHEVNQTSIDNYGRFQYSEILSGSFLQSRVNARANKIINQEGTPAQSVEFTTYRPGLYPGQIIWISSEAHNYLDNLPVRTMNMTFPLPDIVEYRVSCSVDTQDPWGLLLALRRSPTRGYRQPAFAAIDLRRNPDQTIPTVGRYTLVKEYPYTIGNRVYVCSYGYIRNSISVWVGGIRKYSLHDESDNTVGYFQTAPAQGKFQLADVPSGTVYVEYHVSEELP